MNMNWKSAIIALIWMTLASATASAQQPELGTGNLRPYARGVPKEKQERARQLYLAGNASLTKSNYPDAADKYREALEFWDHPSIHYTLAQALRHIGQALEVHHHLTEALRYGDEGPLAPEMRQKAEGLKADVERLLVRLEISCDVPGAAVTMDGKLLFKAPGSYEQWMLPGAHVFGFTKEGYPPNERIRTPAAGEKIILRVQKIYTEKELTRQTKPWATWKPFTVLGAGAVLLAGGGGLHLRARESYRDFDGQAAACGRGGCDPGIARLDLRQRGDTFQRAAMGSYALGGAVFATGAVLAFINRTHSYRILPDEHEKSMGEALQVGANASGAWATLRF